jgi:CRP-like cAMP-binding protein
MALMTGEPRNATVRAVGPCTMLVVDHVAFKRVLDTAPELADHVSRVIADRQAELADRATAMPEAQVSAEERHSQLLGRIRKFFSL